MKLIPCAGRPAYFFSLIVLLCAFAPAHNLQAQEGTPLSGAINSDTTLTLDKSPYLVQSSTSVGFGATLTIQPGVELRFDPGDNYLLVYGDSKLVAEGTASQPIRFTSAKASPAKGDWRGLFLDGQASLAHCDFGFGGWGNEHALRIRHSATALRNTTVHDSAGNGITLDAPVSTPTFENVTLSNNDQAAILFATPEHSPKFSGITVQGNGVDGISIGGNANLSSTLPFAGVPYFVRSRISVGFGATLTIQPGVELRFAPGDNYLLVYGDSRIVAKGSTGFPIRFTSAKVSPAKGDWRGLFLDGSAEFDHCDFGFGGWGNEHALRIRHSATALRNTTVHDSAGNGITLDAPVSTPTFENVTLSNNDQAAILFASPEHSPIFRNLVMQGNGVDGVSIGGSVNIDSVLPPAGYPYFVRSVISVGFGATWTIQPGVELRFAPGDNYILVYGDSRLVAEGGVGTPIRFTSASPNPAPGDWRGLYLDGTASIAYSDIGYAGWANEHAIRAGSSGIRIQNSSIHHSANSAITVINNAQPQINGNQIEQNGFGVWNARPEFLVNAVLNWWGDANGPKHASNPFNAQTTGLAVSDGILFDPWIGKREDAGPFSAAPLKPSFLPWLLFTSDAARVDANGQALAVWRDVLPQPDQGNTTGLTLPMAFAGVQFTLEWKAGDHATFAGDASGAQPFCVDGSWTLLLNGPTPVERSGSGCTDPLDLASLNLADGTYGGQLTLNIPAGAAHYGTGNVFFLSAAYEFREANIPARRSGIRFQADPVTIPAGQVGDVPVRLIASPRPYNGMITHFALDPKAARIERFVLPAGWTGGGSGTLDGIFQEYSNVGPLRIGEIAFTMQVRCVQPGNWPISFAGNAFGLGATNDPSQSMAYLQAVADVFTFTCGEAPPAQTALPLGASVDPKDGTLFVSINGNNLSAAARGELRAGETVVATTQNVQASPNGGTLNAHFGVVPAGTYTFRALDAGGNALADAANVLTPPAMPLFEIYRGDQLAQIPGKKVTHFWSLENKGNVDGVAIVSFSFPYYIDLEPALVRAGLPAGSHLLMHGKLPDDGGWVEIVAVPVRAGGFANIPWTMVLPPDAVFGNPPQISRSAPIYVRTSILAEPFHAQWKTLLAQLGASGTFDAQAVGVAAGDLAANNLRANLSGVAASGPDAIDTYLAALAVRHPELALGVGPYISAINLGMLAADPVALRPPPAPGAVPLQGTPEPTPTNTGLPASSGSNPVLDKMIDLATKVYKKSKDCPVDVAAKEIAKDEIYESIGKAMETMSPATAAVWHAAKIGGWTVKFIEKNLVESGLNDIYEVQRLKYAQPDEGLTPDQQRQLIEEIESVTQHAFGGGSRWLNLLNYLAKGKVSRDELTAAELKRAYDALEFAHFQKRFREEADKDKSYFQTLKDKWKIFRSNKVEVPRIEDDNPCPENTPKEASSYDPNDIGALPAGVPDKNWIPETPRIRYVIQFENLPQATAPAEDVRITARLDPNLDAVTLLPGDSSFPGTQFAYDPVSRMMTWYLPGINLVPNTAPPIGEGWVSFSVAPKPYLPTGAAIRESAQIYFDFNPPIATPEITRTLEVTSPVSKVLPLSETQGFTDFTVQWLGTDQGSGIRDYSVYVSENGSSYRPWQMNTTATSATFRGTTGSAYAFYSVARDRVGNEEESPAEADARTKAGAVPRPDSLGDVNLDNTVNVSDAILVLRFIVGLETLNETQSLNADMNRDSLVNVIDATLILRKAVGLPF